MKFLTPKGNVLEIPDAELGDERAVKMFKLAATHSTDGIIGYMDENGLVSLQIASKNSDSSGYWQSPGTHACANVLTKLKAHDAALAKEPTNAHKPG